MGTTAPTPEPEPQQQSESPELSPAQLAARLITGPPAGATLSAPGVPPKDLPQVKFDRLSVERRVLQAITDDPHTRLGARNTLPALADFLLGDTNTTNPPAPNHRLDVSELSLPDAVQKIIDHLDALITEGLVERKGDVADVSQTTYHVTDAGVAELQAGTVAAVVPAQDDEPGESGESAGDQAAQSG